MRYRDGDFDDGDLVLMVINGRPDHTKLYEVSGFSDDGEGVRRLVVWELGERKRSIVYPSQVVRVSAQ